MNFNILISIYKMAALLKYESAFNRTATLDFEYMETHIITFNRKALDERRPLDFDWQLLRGIIRRMSRDFPEFHEKHNLDLNIQKINAFYLTCADITKIATKRQLVGFDTQGSISYFGANFLGLIINARNTILDFINHIAPEKLKKVQCAITMLCMFGVVDSLLMYMLTKKLGGDPELIWKDSPVFGWTMAAHGALAGDNDSIDL